MLDTGRFSGEDRESEWIRGSSGKLGRLSRLVTGRGGPAPLAARWLLATSLLGGLAGCAADQPEGPQRVFLVSIDTLRPDHLGCYGYPLDTSPNLDSFRDDGILFRQVIAQAPSTLSSHATLFTSLLPQHHGASFAQRRPLAPAARTLAEVVRAGGYRTVALTGGGQLDPVFGVDQGFDEYRMPRDNQVFRKVVRQTLRWLDRNPQERVFFFLHTYQVHHPYRAKKWRLDLLDGPYEGPLPDRITVDLLSRINQGRVSIDERDRRRIVHAYDAEIHGMDGAFGQLVRGLRKRGWYDDALIVVTSDHGEELGEHGKMGWHSHTLYEELLRIPLLVKLPGNRFSGTEITAAVRSLDIAPTLLAVLGLDSPESFQGRNLLRLVERGDGPSLPAVSKRDTEEDIRIESYRHQGWKLYNHRLFHLEEDPLERIDLARRESARVRHMREELEEIVDSRPPLSSEKVETDARTLEELRALGYLD